MRLLSAIYAQLTVLMLFLTVQLSAQNDYIYMPPTFRPDSMFVDTDIIVNSSPFVPTPYYSYQNNSRYQFIYTKEELIWGGAPSDTGCTITSLAWYVVRLVNAAYYQTGTGFLNYTIRMKNIPASLKVVNDTLRRIGAGYIVKGPFNLNQSVISDTGYTDMIFDREFEWDGQGNILIDICYGLNAGSTPAPLGIFSNVNSGVAALSYFGQDDSIQTGIGTAFVTPSRLVCDTTGNATYWFHPRPVSRLNFKPLQPKCKPIIMPSNPEVCAGNQIQLSVTGADSYRWNHPALLSCVNCDSPKASPTRDTTLRVIGQKGSCTDSAFVRIHVINPIPLTIQSTPENITNLCNGSITLNIPQGFSNVKWSDNTSANSLVVNTPGSYGVSAIDSLGCAVSAPPVAITRTNPPFVDILPPGELFLCNGDITLSGTPGLVSFQWSNGSTSPTIVASQAGKYTLRATDSQGCIGISDTTKINAAYTPQVSIMSKGTLVCEGDSSLIECLNTYPSYLWSNGRTSRNVYADAPGNYYVSITDQNGCKATSDTIKFDWNYVPEASFTYEQPFLDYTIQFTNTSLYGRRFFWLFGGGNTSNEENPSFAFPYDDTWPVTLIVTNDCGSDTIRMGVIVRKLVSINDLSLENYWAILPNPAKEMAMLQFRHNTDKINLIEIFNYAGQLLYSESVNINGSEQKQLNLKPYASGIYWVAVSIDGRRNFKKLIIQ